MGRLAEREEQADLVRGGVQPLGERLDVRGQEDRPGLVEQRQPDVGGPEDLARQRPRRLAHLHAEDGCTEALHERRGVARHPERAGGEPGHLAREREADAGQRRRVVAEPLRELVAQDRRERVGDGRRDGRDELVPRGERVLDPLGPAPGLGASAGRREVGDGVEPQLGDGQRLRHGALLRRRDGGVALGHGDLARDVVRDVRVHRAVARRRQQALDLREDVLEQLGVRRAPGGERLGVEAAGAQLAQRLVRVGSEHRAEQLLEPRVEGRVVVARSGRAVGGKAAHRDSSR